LKSPCPIPSLSIVLALACLPVAGRADIFQSGSTTFQYVTLSDPGLQNTLAFGINNLGEIVGYAYNNAGDVGFTYSAGQFSPQVVAGSYSTDIYGVNNAGTLVGSYYNQAGTVVNALVVANGTQQLPGMAQSEYYSINNSGGVVGTTYTATSGGILATGFYQNGPNSSTISYPNAIGTYPHGLNNNGSIVGFYETGADRYGGFLTNLSCQPVTCFTLVGLPGAYSSFAYGLNDSGLIVGASENASGISQGFLYNGSTYTVLDIPGAVSTYATGINDRGQIVGWYQEANGTLQAFEASQVPEPLMSRWQAAMLLFMLAGIKVWTRRRSSARLPRAGGQ
jgi:uncharacterized membrane protein